ncbi:hypothetical protein Tco_1343487, partial [Tanacetum coccineum]
ANDSNPDPTVADDPLGGSFFASPSRSTAAPPDGTTSRGAEDLLTLTALYTLVSEQGKKIGSLESELQAHKLLFKDVMGRLVKRVKILESKLKARGRNVILSESDNEEDEEQDVDSLIKLAKEAAIAADISSVPADAAKATEFPPSSSIPTDAFVHGNAVPTGTASDFSAAPSNKGAEAARKLYEEEQAELTREQEEMKKKRQEDVINSAKYYTDADWSDIMGHHGTKRMVAIIAERRRRFEAQRHNHMMYQLKAEFDKIRNAAADLQAQNLRRSLKRPGCRCGTTWVKKSKILCSSTDYLDRESQSSPAGIQTYSTRRKSLATRKMSSSAVDLNAPDESFIQVLSNDDSDDSDDASDPLFLAHVLLAWEFDSY